MINKEWLTGEVSRWIKNTYPLHKDMENVKQKTKRQSYARRIKMLERFLKGYETFLTQKIDGFNIEEIDLEQLAIRIDLIKKEPK